MNIRICVAFVIASFLAATCTSTANAVDHDQRKAAGTDYEEDTTTDSPMLRRGLAWTPVWWERIKNSYQGDDLKLCTRRSAPAKGSLCGRNKSTCFFGNKTCPIVGANPTVKCFCNGTSTKRGKWSCSPEKCPSPAPGPVSDAGIFRSIPGRAFDVRMNLLTPAVFQGYDKIDDFIANFIER